MRNPDSVARLHATDQLPKISTSFVLFEKCIRLVFEAVTIQNELRSALSQE